MQRIYFDYNSTSPLNRKVQDSMVKLMGQPLNPSSIHKEGKNARGILEKTRHKILETFSLLDTHRLIFTSSCTEANNLVLKNFPSYKKICCQFEHPSVKNLISQQIIELDTEGIIDIDKLRNYLKKHNHNAFIISVMYANNEIGTIQPIDKLINLAKEFNCLLHCDITQALGRIPVLVNDIDLITLSAHKCGGPVGASALLYKKNLQIEPIILGGGQEFGIRSGTQNILAIHGLYTVFTLLNDIISDYTKILPLRTYLEKKITDVSSNVLIAGEKSQRLPNTISLYMPSVSAEIQLIYFDINGFSISAGSACSVGKTSISDTHLAMNIDKNKAQNFIRISLGPKTSIDEINLFIRHWTELYKNNN